MNVSPLIELDDITVRLGSRWFLENTTWRIRPGEHWAVLGPNGSGKSTLARTLVGEVPVVQGRVRRSRLLEGAIRYVSPEAARYVYELEQQEMACRDFSGRSGETTLVADLIRAGNGCEPGSEASLRKISQRMGIESLLFSPVCGVSTGEMRKVLLARALFGRPRMLILDEPFDGLDAASRSSLARLVGSLMRNGLSLVLITHRPDEILPGITHVISLREGRVVGAGPRREIFDLAEKPCVPSASRIRRQVSPMNRSRTNPFPKSR